MKIQRAKQLFLAVVLAASLLPLFCMLLNVKVAASLRKENRILASLPDATWASLADASYFNQFEKYFNDHFGFRDWVIQKKLTFDRAILHRVRPDLIRGQDDFFFYKFIVERYLPNLFASYPRQYMVEVLMELRAELARRGITMAIVHFPNKPLIYPDKLPSYWKIETDLHQLPFYQGIEDLRSRGVPVLSFARDFIALRNDTELFTPAEENHCSAPAYFYSLRRILHLLGKLADVRVELPVDYPKVYSAKIENGSGYRIANHLNTNFPHSIPWTAIDKDSPSFAGRYLFRNPSGILPATTVYTDSFFEVLSSQFSPLLLPYFQELRMDYTTFSPSSLGPDTRMVLLVFSDQSVETHVHAYKKLLARLKAVSVAGTTNSESPKR